MKYKLSLSARKANFLRTLLEKVQSDGPTNGIYQVELSEDASDESDMSDLSEKELEELLEDLKTYE